MAEDVFCPFVQNCLFAEGCISLSLKLSIEMYVVFPLEVKVFKNRCPFISNRHILFFFLHIITLILLHIVQHEECTCSAQRTLLVITR